VQPLDPDRSDEVIARVNLFNYGGALIGAVALGALAGNASALGLGFALPVVVLLLALPLLRAHRRAGSRR
jgi:predicted branched-subunit amino acid permease